MKKGIALIALLCVYGIGSAQHDWDGVEIPAEAGNRVITWKLVENMSDDFNYTSPSAEDMGATFYAKWRDGFLNAWTGPNNTFWSPASSIVRNGNLEITASRNSGTVVNFQAITTKAKIKYPCYVETRMKVMNSVMANAVWMLSDKSTEEIDIVEAYGSSYSNSKPGSTAWYAQRMHLSHHTFVRDPFQDYQPKDAGTWYNDGSLWRTDFRRVGLYWRDPFHLEYYIDGVLVRTVSGASKIDPDEHLDGNGLSEEETLIISGASQGWQVTNGIYPTDAELAVLEDNVFKVDWVRTYTYADATGMDHLNDLPVVKITVEPQSKELCITFAAQLQANCRVQVYNNCGQVVKSAILLQHENQLSLAHLPSGIYHVQVITGQEKKTSSVWF